MNHDKIDIPEDSFMETINKYCMKEDPVKLTEKQKELLNKIEYTQLRPPFSTSTMRSFCGNLRIANGLIKNKLLKLELNDHGIMEYWPV